MAVVTELVTRFGFEGSTAPLADYNKALGQAIKGLAGFAAAAGVALVAGAGILGIINKETSQMSSLAEAVGLTTREFQAYGAAATQVGLDSEVVVDLFEEMNNKFGESTALMAQGQKPLGAVSDALGILGIKFKDIANLKPADQFRAISKAIEAMPDTQRAVSAADILFGGDANKFFANMKKTGQTLDSLIKKYDAINFLTKEGTEGAKLYSRSLGEMGILFSSVGREISGIIGGQLSPELENLTKGFSDLVKENREWVIGVASKTAEIAVAIGKAINRLTPFLIASAGAWGIITLATGGFATVMATVMSPVTLTIAAIAAGALIIDDLIVAFQGGNSVIAEFAQTFLGIDIMPGLKAMVDGVKWAVREMISGFKFWFDFFAAGWTQYKEAIATVSSFFGSGEVTIRNDVTRAGGSVAGTSGGGRVNNNKVENTTNITIQSSSISEARAGVDNALQDQLRNTETALNRID